jgi:hypothetical protein
VSLGSTQTPIQLAPAILSLGVKRPGSETNHPLSSSSDVKNEWRCIPLPNMLSQPTQSQIFLLLIPADSSCVTRASLVRVKCLQVLGMEPVRGRSVLIATVRPNYSTWPLLLPPLADVTYRFPTTLLSGQTCRGAQSVTPYPQDASPVICILLHEQLITQEVMSVALHFCTEQSPRRQWWIIGYLTALYQPGAHPEFFIWGGWRGVG